MYRKRFGSKCNSQENSPEDRRTSARNSSGYMPHKWLNCSKNSRENPLSKIWNLKFLRETRRKQQMSDARRSPYSCTSTSHERSRTDVPLICTNRKSASNSVFQRLALPRSSGLTSVYLDADAWVTDSMADKSRFPRRRKGKWITKEGATGPFMGSYQLLGDSPFFCFGNQILKSPAVIGANRNFCNGYCVSGQTITDLDERVSIDFISTDVIVMIRTNDFLRRLRFQSMKNDMKSLLDFLGCTAERVVILTLSSIPCLERLRAIGIFGKATTTSGKSWTMV